MTCKRIINSITLHAFTMQLLRSKCQQRNEQFVKWFHWPVMLSNQQLNIANRIISRKFNNKKFKWTSSSTCFLPNHRWIDENVWLPGRLDWPSFHWPSTMWIPHRFRRQPEESVAQISEWSAEEATNSSSIRTLKRGLRNLKLRPHLGPSEQKPIRPNWKRPIVQSS